MTKKYKKIITNLINNLEFCPTRQINVTDTSIDTMVEAINVYAKGCVQKSLQIAKQNAMQSNNCESITDKKNIKLL